MGSILKSISRKKNRSASYSLGKQKEWHLATDVASLPKPRPLGKAERVEAADYCHRDLTAIVIP
ncbi:MAG: hypothetical protein K2H76_09185 [Muribaculaceae bacterium]|nr:hypothetical protein [Muribaculaceae bacterium]MDE6028599.1 hypothetical protein [Muribaculaceae bacterium]